MPYVNDDVLLGKLDRMHALHRFALGDASEALIEEFGISSERATEIIRLWLQHLLESTTPGLSAG